MAGIFGTNTLFSAVTGKVVIDGEPVANAKIEQRTNRGTRGPVVKTLETAADGSFAFEAVTENKSLFDYLPSEFVSQQEITITYKGKSIKGWVYTKRDSAAGSETPGRKFSMICDVSTEADFAEGYYGICRLADK